MDYKIILNAFGLGLGMLGTGLMAWSSIQYPFLKDKNERGASIGSILKDNPLRPDQGKKNLELWRMRVGLILLGIGFLLQFIALFS